MANTQPIPTQIADAPDSSFRAPFFEINPNADHATAHSSGVALRASLSAIHPTAAPTPPHPAPSAPHPAVHAAAACPPAPGNNIAAPAEIHEPAPGQRVEITVTPNQPLALDFNPLDAKAVLHGNDLTLTFADGGVVVLHHITENGNPLPTPLQLPDGTIINPCELLQALPGEQANPSVSNEKIPNEKIPLEHIPVVGAHPVVTNFALPGLGHGLIPLGGLPPEGFSTTTIFPPPGNGGFPPSPPGPPGPPPPPHFLSMIEDSHLLTYPATTTTGDIMTDTFFGHPIVTSEPAAHVDSYVFWQPGSVVVDPATDPAGVAAGLWGSLNMQANGDYTYTLNAAGIAAGSQLGADILSQELSNPATPDTPYPLLDLFTVTVDNGFDTASQQLAMYTVATNIVPSQTTAGVAGTTVGAPVLVTYTDLADPAHSFQEQMTVTAGGTLVPVTADGAPIQPHDAALVTLEYEGTATNITGFTIGGESVTGLNIPLDANDHALTAIINPDLSSFGDTGDTGSVIVVPTGYTNVTGDFPAVAAGQYVFENAGHNGATLSVTPGSAADATGAVLNIGTNTGGLEQGGLGSDVLVYNGDTTGHYNGGAGVVINGSPTEAGTLTFFVDNSNPLAHLTNGVEAVTINVTTGESADAMASALATAINGDAHLSGIGLSADYGGGDSFQLVQSVGSLSYDSLTTFEGLAQSTSGNPAAETITGQAGIDTLRIDTGSNTIDMTNAATLHEFANIDVIDMTAAAFGAAATNSLTLDANSVLQLTANENAAIPTYTGGNAMWVEGTANDSVTLNGFTQISSPIDSSTQLPIVQTSAIPQQTSASQMVGFAEYSGTATNGQTVHVYVANAIVNAGHVTLH